MAPRLILKTIVSILEDYLRTCTSGITIAGSMSIPGGENAIVAAVAAVPTPARRGYARARSRGDIPVKILDNDFINGRNIKISAADNALALGLRLQIQVNLRQDRRNRKILWRGYYGIEELQINIYL